MPYNPKFPSKNSHLGFLFLILLGGLVGCSNLPLKGGFGDDGSKVFLTSEADLKASLETFARNQDLKSEEGKINYLLYRIRRSNLTFIRNDSPFTSAEAAEFLRWKLNRPRWRPLVKSAYEFVVLITKSSVHSGDPYELVMENKERRDLASIMLNELNYLEDFLNKENNKEKPVKAEEQKPASVTEPEQPATETEVPAENEENVALPAEVVTLEKKSPNS